MVAPISQRPSIKTKPAHKPTGPTKADFRKSLEPFMNAAYDKGGIRDIKKPSAEVLKGAKTVDLAKAGDDFALDILLAKNGDIFMNLRAPGRPEQWGQVKPSFIRKYFEKEIAKEHVSVKKPANASAYPNYDVTPPQADGVARLYQIKGQNYVTYTTPSMPEQWYRLDAKKASVSNWKPN